MIERILANKTATVDATAAKTWGYCSEQHMTASRTAAQLATAKNVIGMNQLVDAVTTGDYNKVLSIKGA